MHADSWTSEDELSLPVLFAWVRSNWRKMAAGGVVFAILSIPIILLQSKTYDSTAILLVSPPAFKDSGAQSARSTSAESPGIGEMLPRTLPVEAYKAIAVSDPILHEVIQRVPLEKTGTAALRNRLEVELVQMGSRGSQGVVYTQTLLFRAKANNPELAAKTAQSWADVFKEQVDDVASKGTGETFSLLDTLHETTKKQFEMAKSALAEHVKTWNLDLIKAQIAAKQTQFTTFEDKLKQTEVEIASTGEELKRLEEELVNEPQKLTYFRAPSDDAYWITAQANGKPRVEPEQGLRTEEPNENYVQIRLKVVTAKSCLDGLKAERDAIQLKLDELKTEITDLVAISADQSVERDKLTLDSTSLETSYKIVREEFEKGRMADQTQASDIVIVGEAIAPESPSGPNALFEMVEAGILGVLLVGGFLAFRDISKMVPSKNSPKEA